MKTMILLLLFWFCFCQSFSSFEDLESTFGEESLIPVEVYSTCYYDGGKYSIKDGKDIKGVAWGYFDDSIETVGYGIVSVSTNGNFDDDTQMKCAGYLEGYLSVIRIDQLFRSFWESTFSSQSIQQKIVQFTAETIQWTKKQASDNKNTDPYWKQVSLILSQLQGLTDGYNSVAISQGIKSLKFEDLFLLNMIGDLDDLIPAFSPRTSPDKHREWVALHSHCSAIIKPTADMKELFVAHEMWASYIQMLNVFKHYNFQLSGGVFGRVSFSGYPGLLSSEDDFYIVGSGLVVLETTNGIFNLSLYDAISPQTLMSWIRVVVSNRMATDGQKWTNIMQQYNSGTYNNQWMVVDFKKFKPGASTLAAGTLWIGSQIPGYFESADVTSVVNSQGYWPSYNIPYFKDIFNIAGYQTMVDKYGSYWTYNGYPRAKIFAKRQGSVKDLRSIQELMRYNDYQHDPISLGCSCNQLACRGDLAVLNDTTQCFPGAFGAINGKITSSSRVPHFEASIIGGPTHHTLPPFEWTDEIVKKFPNAKHYGQPKRFNFRWQTIRPEQK